MSRVGAEGAGPFAPVMGGGRIACPPFQVDAASAAALAGEKSARAFRSRVGSVYPQPTARIGGKDLWLTEDLERAIRALHRGASEDLADMI